MPSRLKLTLFVQQNNNATANSAAVLAVSKKLPELNANVLLYKLIRKSKDGLGSVDAALLKEHNLISVYINNYFGSLSRKNFAPVTIINNFQVGKRTKILSTLPKEKRGYIKHMVRLRYRWHFRHELGQFKLFRKFFRRSLKRYRKIQKNRLFMTKFRKNFSKLTGFTEKFIYDRWLQFHRSYNQYWSTSNAVLRFSQSLMLAPYGFLIIAKIAPSLAASKHLINSGAVNINGATVTSFSNFVPGDILQINLAAVQGLKALFNYQHWHTASSPLPFIDADWSCMLFIFMRWPRNYELIAPSFLSERWVRYYIRNFPSKAAKFKKISYNTKVYKQLIIKK